MADLKAEDHQPGNGTRYVIVTGTYGKYNDPFVAIPNLGRTALMALRPASWEYVAEKLNLRPPDAKAVWHYLNGTELPDSDKF